MCDIGHPQPSTPTHFHPRPSPHDDCTPLSNVSMSTSNQTTWTHPSSSSSPSSNFTLIFDTAVDEYKRLTRLDLRTHPLAAAFDVCNSPDIILTIFRRQAQAIDRIRKGDDKLLIWLDPTVQVLFTSSTTLGEGIGLVSPSFLPCINPQRLYLGHIHLQPRSSQVLVFSSG